MNDKIFNEQWAILKNAFPANSLAYTPESQRIYRNDLKGFRRYDSMWLTE